MRWLSKSILHDFLSMSTVECCVKENHDFGYQILKGIMMVLQITFFREGKPGASSTACTLTSVLNILLYTLTVSLPSFLL